MKVNPYLNFDGQAEEAFKFYRSVFGGEFIANMKMNEAPGGEKLPKDEQQRTLHISLPLGKNTVLMASDIMPSYGQTLNKGNTVYVSIHPTTRAEADRIFNALSEGGTVEMPIEDQFWGDYFGSLIDKFDIHWMVNQNDAY